MKVLVFSLICLTSFSLFAQHTVSGTVTDDSNNPLPGVTIIEKGTAQGTITDLNGQFSITVKDSTSSIIFSYVGYITQEMIVGNRQKIDITLFLDTASLDEIVVVGYVESVSHALTGSVAGVSTKSRKGSGKIRNNKRASSHQKSKQANHYAPQPTVQYHPNNEEYAGYAENKFELPTKEPLSTFSIDVDAASYSNVRRFLEAGQMPPADAVRIEELINYFDYDYPQPEGELPFSITTNSAAAPWNPQHQLVHIGLQGKDLPKASLPASNFVFLLDVSGSMSADNKLPLLKSSLKLLVNQMREKDRVAIVVYAGNAGVVLPSTSGDDKNKIIAALDQLQAAGSTAGGQGIELAYNIAKKHFVEGGNNRVIMATDGDFNVGPSSKEALEDLIELKRKENIYLTVLGFGMGNYKDARLETLADKGNGNYAYIDNMQEAQKSLITEFGGTMYTIAKDVKIQVEFNPAKVQAYRLIGYENRALEAEDFNNDTKDAGELGVGHTVTALYEIIPTGVESNFIGKVDPLKYQKQIGEQITTTAAETDEILTVKLRYKAPDKNKSELITRVLTTKDESAKDQNLNWSACVAAFGMLLTNSPYISDMDYDQILAVAKQNKGDDENGYRSEFIQLVKLASNLGTN